MSHLSLKYPEDAKAVASDDTFMFGPDLLAAPVVQPGATSRNLYLPPGRWIDFWNAVTYKEGGGDLRLRRARTQPGGRDVSMDAPLEELPLMVRAGAILPLLPADTDTLADRYDSSPKIVSLREQRRKMEVMAFPRGRSSASFGTGGETLVSREKKGGTWKLRIKGKTKRAWRIEASVSTLKKPFRPSCVTVNGDRISKKRWSYGKKKRRVVVRLKAKKATVAVRATCRST